MDKIIDAVTLRDSKLLREVIEKNGTNVSSEWGIIHYLVHNDWYDGIALYKIYLNGEINCLTTDFCGTTSGIPIYIIGGQNALFMSRSQQMIDFLFEFGINEVIDNNGNSYQEYLSKKNDFSFYRENYLKVKERIKFLSPLGNISSVDGDIELVTKNEIYVEYIINHELFQYFDSEGIIDNSCQNANSMHKNSCKIIITNRIKQMILSLFKNENINIYSIHDIIGFLIEYKERGDKKLNMHMDDSKYTINICLENTSDCKLIFDGYKLPVISKKGNLLFHNGKIPHYVTELTYGTKKNIILWIS
jgi:hypothetical protein